MTPRKVLLSRWQFGVTIVYHFLFVPLTIGLAVAAPRSRPARWASWPP
jgi:cytochrome bd-type quinol oxidase subunit 1